jgi:hypothetical protein
MLPEVSIVTATRTIGRRIAGRSHSLPRDRLEIRVHE